MKKLLLLIAVLFFVGTANVSAQCDSDKFMDHCTSKLADGFTFLKSYTIDGAKGGKVEYSYVFSKDTTYLLTLCGKEGNPKNLYVTLFDSNRNQLMSSFNQKADKYMPMLGYRCSATGIYYISFQFNGQGDCGAGVLAFKR